MTCVIAVEMGLDPLAVAEWDEATLDAVVDILKRRAEKRG